MFVYASDLKNWMPYSLEIQIADNFDPKWANSPASWQCGALFGLQPATQKVVLKAARLSEQQLGNRDSFCLLTISTNFTQHIE
ncbi:protein of unknown function DUF1080 [Fibrisoma limi BUZ 3]|uniref:Uncharacterized protein n=1 Tax=Fibrisoma limi BUZ 3 TaxID=1185876 RepID=I2GK55_9BACT|nr:protein of unknown function DUF1080 [Fibrisoma limi]CCH54280.1 protein of unknown function DUF1080 [Fibrisoma limi BUZ 3]